MAFTLWLSAEEEQILEKIMSTEGNLSKEQAVIRAIRDKGATLTTTIEAPERIPATAGLPAMSPSLRTL